MPTRSEQVQLLVGGRFHDDWEHYEIDSNLLIPADDWTFTLGVKSGRVPEEVKVGASVEVRIGDDPVLTGRIDTVAEPIETGNHEWHISGKDGAEILVECSAPIFSAQMVDLDEIVAKIVRPLGIRKIRIDAASTRTREKVNVEPGDSAWAALANAAEANGLWPWFDPDGTLVVGGPDYSKPPVATLIMRYSGKGNNVTRLVPTYSMSGRYSEVTVLGQSHSTETEEGKHNLKYTAKDTGVSQYRPHIVVDHEADSLAVCESRARKRLADGRLKGFTLTAHVSGHRIVAPGQPGDGLLWTPGQRVRVISEPHGIDAVFFMMARKFVKGPRSELTLKEDRAWLLDAHPHKNKHRRGKNDAPGQIVDASAGAGQ